jgi:CelD/BcsL family acetyltransferase involved in cellulose biosynthesis
VKQTTMKQTKLGSMPLLDAVIIEDAEGFAALEEEWEGLYRASPLATPFQSWAWLYSWWESYGDGYGLRLIAVRDETSLLVGLLPLMLERRVGFGRLLFVGTGITDQLDVLAREGWEARVAEVGGRILRQMGSWHVADLQEVRPEAVAWDLFRGWDGPRVHTWQSNCTVVDAVSWEGLLTRCSRKVRNNARQTVRRAKEDGVRREVASRDEVEQAARRWLGLHRKSWQGKGINQEHLTRRFGSHILAAAKRMSASGSGEMHEFRQGEEVVASDFVLLGHEYVGSYLDGANEYAFRRFRTSALFTWNLMNVAFERGSPAVNMLRGEEPQKLRWNPEIVVNHRLILSRNRISFAPYAAYHLLRSKAAEYAKSEDAPAWIKPATEQLKGFLIK